jgi:hypothetical protein
VADVEKWLPAIQTEIPGCGITPFNVWHLTFQWWRIYRDVVEAAVNEAKKSRETRRGK